MVLAARAATPRRALALPSNPGGFALADWPLRLCASRQAPSAEHRLHPRASRGRCQLVHRPAFGAHELLAGPFGKRAPPPASDGRSWLEPAKIQRLVAELRHGAAILDREIRPGLTAT